MNDSRERALRLAPELKVIQAELETYESLLKQWQRSINLVSVKTLDDIWVRHFADSAQVRAASPSATVWADIGSGGGFPGLVTALLMKGESQAVVHLVESDQRKAAFLRAVSRETGAPAIVHVGRIESVLPKLEGIQAVSARALAPLSQLLALTKPALEKGATGVFLKGSDWEQELTEIGAASSLKIETLESRTDERARLVVVRRLSQASIG